MAKVINPFYSTFATGSLGKTLTVSPRYNNNTFVMSMYKQRSGKRYPIQDENARIFGDHSTIVAVARRIFYE